MTQPHWCLLKILVMNLLIISSVRAAESPGFITEFIGGYPVSQVGLQRFEKTSGNHRWLITSSTAGLTDVRFVWRYDFNILTHQGLGVRFRHSHQWPPRPLFTLGSHWQPFPGQRTYIDFRLLVPLGGDGLMLTTEYLHEVGTNHFVYTGQRVNLTKKSDGGLTTEITYFVLFNYQPFGFIKLSAGPLVHSGAEGGSKSVPSISLAVTSQPSRLW